MNNQGVLEQLIQRREALLKERDKYNEQAAIVDRQIQAGVWAAVVTEYGLVKGALLAVTDEFTAWVNEIDPPCQFRHDEPLVLIATYHRGESLLARISQREHTLIGVPLELIQRMHREYMAQNTKVG